MQRFIIHSLKSILKNISTNLRLKNRNFEVFIHGMSRPDLTSCNIVLHCSKSGWVFFYKRLRPQQFITSKKVVLRNKNPPFFLCPKQKLDFLLPIQQHYCKGDTKGVSCCQKFLYNILGNHWSDLFDHKCSTKLKSQQKKDLFPNCSCHYFKNVLNLEYFHKIFFNELVVKYL